MNVAVRKVMTREEFFQWAEAQDGRYEFDGFQPVAMVGGTRNHSTIAANLIVQLSTRLRGSPCQPLGSDAGVATVDERVRYPDALVTCTRSGGRDRLIPNPVIVFEVLSSSTAREDRITKVVEYHAVASIKRYVMVEQDSIGLMVLSRKDDEPWTTTVLTQGGTLSLPEVGIEIPVDEIYERIVFDSSEAAQAGV